MPRSFPLLLALVLSDVAELFEHLRERLLLPGRPLWIEDWWGRTILSESLLQTKLRLRLHPVSMLVLGLSESSFERVRADHAVVDVVHVRG